MQIKVLSFEHFSVLLCNKLKKKCLTLGQFSFEVLVVIWIELKWLPAHKNVMKVSSNPEFPSFQIEN